jgi:hypothetical protein
LRRTVVPGFYVLTYRGCGTDAKPITFNAANSEVPMIDGRHINYEPQFLFDSPYLKRRYNTGIIWAGFGKCRMQFDFNK